MHPTHLGIVSGTNINSLLKGSHFVCCNFNFFGNDFLAHWIALHGDSHHLSAGTDTSRMPSVLFQCKKCLCVLQDETAANAHSRKPVFKCVAQSLFPEEEHGTVVECDQLCSFCKVCGSWPKVQVLHLTEIDTANSTMDAISIAE